MREHALALRSAGMSVIPVEGKRPLVPWQEYQSRQASEAEIDGWYTAWPDAGVGIVTGRISNLVVLDVDGQVTAPASWVSANVLEPTVAVQTPRGGLHLYYAHPGREVRNSAGTLEIGGLPCDVRGDGGFVVAPPSPGYKRLPYWTSVAPWREWWAGTAPRTSGLESLTLPSSVDDLFAPAPEGQRNHAAAKLAGYLLKVGDEAAAWAQIRQWNGHNPSPLGEVELRRTFESIARRERMKPVDSVDSQRPSDGPPADLALMGAAWADAIADAPERSGITLDCVPISSSWKGFCPGDLTLLAARPGTGKSTLAWAMAWELAVEKAIPTLLFSGEMSPADVARWMTQIRTGRSHIGPEDWHGTLDALRTAPIGIVHRGIMTPGMIADTLEAHPSAFVIIDHIQKCRLAKSESRNHELEQIASELKALAMARATSIFALCQLNRLADNVEHPTIAHLRDSGGLEQEADTVLGLSHVGDRMKQDPLQATVRLATLKSRHGPENLEQIAWFHKTTKRFEWLNSNVDWRAVS
jgi:hypothetical protein